MRSNGDGGTAMHQSVIDWIKRTVKEEDIRGKIVIEVGSRDINGSIKSLITQYNPDCYIGIDAEAGEGVDLISNFSEKGEVGYVLNHMGEDESYDSVDVVICLETLEHVHDWKGMIRNIKDILDEEGILFLTTRSKGFPYHPYPEDYWRFSIQDMEMIFGPDFIIEILQPDPFMSGVFLKAIKRQHDFLINIEVEKVKR